MLEVEARQNLLLRLVLTALPTAYVYFWVCCLSEMFVYQEVNFHALCKVLLLILLNSSLLSVLIHFLITREDCFILKNDGISLPLTGELLLYQDVRRVYEKGSRLFIEVADQKAYSFSTMGMERGYMLCSLIKSRVAKVKNA